MGGWIAWDVADVVADACPCEAHPVGHLSSEKFAARRDLVLVRIGVALHDITARIEDFSVKIRALILYFFEDLVISGRGFVRRFSSRHWVVECDFAIVKKLCSLGRKVDSE